MGDYDSWNTIPYDSSTPPEEKAAQFEAQWEENGGNKPQEDNNPYSKENFGDGSGDRRGK